MTDTAHDFPEPNAKARALIAVEIHVETDPGIDNPIQGYEPAYDFVVIREAEAVHTEFYAGDTALMKGLCSTEIETYDLDPDDLLAASVIDGLTPPIDEDGYPQQDADEATQQHHYAHMRDAVAQVIWGNTNQTGYSQGLEIADQILTMLAGAQKVQTKTVGR